MRLDDVEALYNWLDRIGSLPIYQRDLIENAIFCLKRGFDDRARDSLKTMAYNYHKSGDGNAAAAVERLL